MQKDARIYVAGHTGLVGSALCRYLKRHKFNNLITRSHAELDLKVQTGVERFFADTRPEYVFDAAAVVGGIQANAARPVEFLRDNLLIQTHIVEAAYRYGAKKLAFLGSTCIYPRDCPQPIKEDYLLSGPLEATNQWYAIAKIAGLKLCEAYHRQYGFNAIALMPTNLYGPGDNFSLPGSHVLPALLRKFHEAKIRRADTVEVWGSGRPRREFLYVDDLAEAAVFLMQNYHDPAIINIGAGKDISIRELAGLIKDIVGYEGRIIYNADRPDGTPRKLCDITRLSRLGWQSRTTLRQGIELTYAWFRGHYGPDSSADVRRPAAGGPE